MSEQTEPIDPDSAPPAATAEPVTSAPSVPTAAPIPTPTTGARRSVTLPLLPLAIVGGVIVALLFFGGGVAIGYGVASHDSRSDNAQQYRGGSGFGFGDRNGTGVAPGQNQGGQNQRPGDRPTTAPRNG